MDDLKFKSLLNSTKNNEFYSSLERRIERLEKNLSIADEISILKTDQEEAKQYEIDRRLDTLDNRLKRIEKNVTNMLIDLEDKIEQQSSQIYLVKQIPIINSEIEDLKCAFYSDERITELEKELNAKILKMFETIEDMSRNVNYKEKEIERLKREIEELKSENEKLFEERDQQTQKIKELISQMEEI